MKPVISICPCGVAIQYIAEKTRRVGSRSKTVTGNTHCIALWVYGLTPKMIRPSKTDCFLRAKISDLKKPLPKLDTISDPNSSLFSGAIARPQSPTSWRKKNWFKLSYQNWPMKLPETRSWHDTRTWSIVSRSDWQELIKGTILETSTSIFFPCFIVICVSKSGPQTKKQWGTAKLSTDPEVLAVHMFLWFLRIIPWNC